MRDCIRPGERIVACLNQNVVYGLGMLDAERGSPLVQVPDFGGRFWVYQAVDQRTDPLLELGATYGTKPGHHLPAPAGWSGETPDGSAGCSATTRASPW